MTLSNKKFDIVVVAW